MIKKGLLLIGIISVLFSCRTEAPKDYASLSGKVTNPTVKEILIQSRAGYSKKIKINDDGTFSDTLHLKDKGAVYLFAAKGTIRVFLKNDDDLKINFDEKDINKTIKFSGKGAKTNNYIIAKNNMQKNYNIDQLFSLDKEKFAEKSKAITKDFENLMAKFKDIDTAYYAQEKAGLASLPKMLQQQYDKINQEKNKNANLIGKPSPEFNNYENYKGGTTSLKDLRGKYVYIDVWATWCRPCVGEIPHLLKLEKELHGKNIAFVSISVDRETSKAAWKKMIADKKMGGIQLFAKKGDNFAKDYKISSIPRFILLDPKGNIVKANMTRPSNPQTKTFLTNLLK